MKTLTLKKITTAMLAATCVLGMGMVQATPKLALTIGTPANTAGADKAVSAPYANQKTIPWLPCTAGATTLGSATNTTAKFNDLLQFDLNVTNADDNKDTNKLVDYDLYVFFINYSASGSGVAADIAHSKFYALTTTKSGFGGGTPVLTPYIDSNTGTHQLNEGALKPSDIRYMANTDFTSASLKQTIFGGPISLDATGLNLAQGLWSVLTVMVDPAVVAPNTAADTAKLQNPQNWAAWSVQPFVVGTPFATAYGTTNGVVAGTSTCK